MQAPSSVSAPFSKRRWGGTDGFNWSISGLFKHLHGQVQQDIAPHIHKCTPPKLILNDALLKQLAAQFLVSGYYPLFMSEERREGGKERGRRMEGEREREIEIDR